MGSAPPEFTWEHAESFYQTVQEDELHGLHFQHVMLCHRRAWMYLHRINFAQWHSRVKTGTALHSSSYQRDRSVRGLLGLAPDRVDWEQHIVYENKGSGGAREAANAQTAFYALMLSIQSGVRWRAYTHVLTTKKRREVLLDETQLETLWQALATLKHLRKSPDVPPAQKISLCSTCSLAAFCGFD